MKILYLDCQAGISGDMLLGALIDLGASLEKILSGLKKVDLDGEEINISLSNVSRKGIFAKYADVQVADSKQCRTLSSIEKMIAASSLSESVKERSIRIFRVLAEAEAKIHGCYSADVHFHEVGALDSIADIVGISIAFELLCIDKFFVSSLPLSHGFVESSHGTLSLPAPATAELLKGFRLHPISGAGERVTPTGAAVIAALADKGDLPHFTIENTGYGAGKNDFTDTPNILRIFTGYVETSSEEEEIFLLETQIDDSTPEALGFLMERLFAEGALDVFFTPIQMKKNRPASLVSAICREETYKHLTSVILAESSTLGVRISRQKRVALQRRMIVVKTKYGEISVKEAKLRNITKYAPEYDDCSRSALKHAVPLDWVYEEARRMVNKV